MNIETRAKKIFLVASAVLAIMLPTGYALKVANSEVGVGAISRFAYATGEDLVQTNSSAWVPMPDMLTNFYVRPTDRFMPLMIRFTGAGNTNGASGSMRIQVRVDGVTLPFASDLQLTADSIRQPFAFTWVAEDMTHGFHAVEVFWRHSTGETAWIQDRCLVVEGH